MIFKNNAELIIPLVLTLLPFPTKCIKEADVEMILNFNFIVIHVENYKVKESILEKDKNFYNVEYTQNGMIIRYSIPETRLYICKILMKCGYNALLKDELFDCVSFWKKDCVSVLLNNKTLTARESSQGFFF